MKFNIFIVLNFQKLKINNMVTLENVAAGLQQEISLNKSTQNFIYASCYKCHSKQGCSIAGDVIVSDWMYNYVSKEWIYTCITKSKDLNNVKLYKYEITKNRAPNKRRGLRRC